MAVGLQGVGDLALHIILSRLSARDLGTVGCASARLKALASDDSLWSKICSDELDLSAPLDPIGNATPSFKEAYQIWRKAFASYPWPLVRRVKRCWCKLRAWFDTNFPEAAATLQVGASESEISEMEKALKVKLPLPTRLLYRFCNGQRIFAEESIFGSALGLIGGYSFYDHEVNVYLLPLSEVMLETKEVMRHLNFTGRLNYVVVAASSTRIGKFFFLNCTNAQLYVGTRNLKTDGEMLPCVPSELISSAQTINSGEQPDAMLLWLEEHVCRLQNGVVRPRKEGEVLSINLFPEVLPLCSTAVTHGVQVRASAVFVPELSDLQDESDKCLFAYSICMRLLPEGCAINGRLYRSCQLYSRHWIIRAHDNVVSDVDGEAVIGKFPLLRPGEEEFVYESCTPLQTCQGSVEGYFVFVPGRLEDPKGDPFQVEVAQFPLRLPDYIF